MQHFRRASLLAAGERAGLSNRSIETESIDRHVEGELSNWLRRRALVPRRLTLALGLTTPLASYLARRSMAEGCGEAFIAIFEK